MLTFQQRDRGDSLISFCVSLANAASPQAKVCPHTYSGPSVGHSDKRPFSSHSITPFAMACPCARGSITIIVRPFE